VREGIIGGEGDVIAFKGEGYALGAFIGEDEETFEGFAEFFFGEASGVGGIRRDDGLIVWEAVLNEAAA
jgi:hypothetical protein